MTKDPLQLGYYDPFNSTHTLNFLEGAKGYWIDRINFANGQIFAFGGSLYRLTSKDRTLENA